MFSKTDKIDLMSGDLMDKYRNISDPAATNIPVNRVLAFGLMLNYISNSRIVKGV